VARMPTRFVRPLSDEHRVTLEHLKERGETPRIRRRAHAVLLNAAGKSISEIAEIFHTMRVTVSSWLDRWEKDGPLGLGDAPRPGGPSILTGAERQQVVEIIKEHSRSRSTVLTIIQETTGKPILQFAPRCVHRKLFMAGCLRFGVGFTGPE
jgi:transposase